VNRAKVIDAVAFFVGGCLLVISFRYGFGIDADWYWWAVLGAGLGVFKAA
jgi:hypothetical protein